MKNNVFPILMIILFCISSCANTIKVQSRTLEDYYVSTGVNKYFLADIPSWANFDQKSGCFRKTIIRYFNIDALIKSYNLTYNQALQIQASFNEEFVHLKKINELQAPTLREEELLFYKVNEKVSNKIVFFDPPIFNRVNLVWLDEIVGDDKKEKKLKKLLKSSVMDIGVPVLVSFCMTRDEVEKNFPDFHVKMITAELFSIYDYQGKVSPGFKIDLDQFFRADQKLYFYSQKNLVPFDFIKGTLTTINY